jgi:hypothetical protein
MYDTKLPNKFMLRKIGSEVAVQPFNLCYYIIDLSMLPVLGAERNFKFSDPPPKKKTLTELGMDSFKNMF